MALDENVILDENMSSSRAPTRQLISPTLCNIFLVSKTNKIMLLQCSLALGRKCKFFY